MSRSNPETQAYSFIKPAGAHIRNVDPEGDGVDMYKPLPSLLEATSSRRDAIIALAALVGTGVIAAPVGALLLKKRTSSEKPHRLELPAPDALFPNIPSSNQDRLDNEMITTWSYTAEWGDTYWGIVESHYGEQETKNILSFTQDNIRNKTAETEARDKNILEEGYPYMKEPLVAGDELEITDPTCPIPDKWSHLIDKEDPDCVPDSVN